ncbi:MAG: H-type lectin domain-containing protein, partial [Pseudomonadota bacterium]
GDGVGDNGDAFPNDPTETADSDGDGVGDNADVFPNDPAETADSDGDGVGDNGDAFPNDPTETADSDGDGVGDNADAFPNDPTETADSDGDGIGDNADPFPNDPNLPNGSVAYQAGSITIEQPDGNTWFSVSFDTEFAATPVVVMGPITLNGGHPVTLRVRNVTSAGFEYQMDEWEYLDGYHTTETFSWLAMMPGRHELGSLSVEAGSITATNARATYSFDEPFAAAPMLLSQVVTVNEATAVTTRQRTISGGSFQLELEEEEALVSSGHAAETVHYIAIEYGASDLPDGQSIGAGATGNSVTHTWTTASFGSDYSGGIFLAAMQTTDGGDTSNVRYRNLSGTSVEVTIDEEQSANSEINHTSEVVGWLRLTLP